MYNIPLVTKGGFPYNSIMYTSYMYMYTYTDKDAWTQLVKIAKIEPHPN